MRERCPTCGGPMASDKITVCLKQNAITHRGHTVRLTALQAELAHMLAREAPKAVPQERIRIGLWGTQDGPANETAMLSQHVCKLRKKLRTIGLTINLARGAGYYITTAENAAIHPPRKVTWSKKLVEQYTEMRRQGRSREQILYQLGLTLKQLRSLHNFLRARRNFPYLFPPLAIDLRRADAKPRRQMEEAAP